MTRTTRAVVYLSVFCVMGAGSFVRAEVSATSDRQATIHRSRAMLAEAQADFAAGRTDSALVRLETVLDEDPANPDAFYYMGLIRLSLADTSGAQAALAEGVRLAPMSRRLKLLLARIWVDEGKVDEAEALVDEVMAIRPRDLDALYIRGLIALARNDAQAAMDFWDEALAEELGGGAR